MRVALSDGTLAKSGGKVIKNVAGYDLAKLFAGAYGTLGAIVEVSVRLHPAPPATATALGSSHDPDELGRAARALARSPLEHHGLDVRWAAGGGAVLTRFAGAAPRPQAEAAAGLLREDGIAAEIAEDDDALWQAQREGQRAGAASGGAGAAGGDAGGLGDRAAPPNDGAGAAIVRVSGLPTQIPAVLRSAERLGAAVVGRASLGLFWLRLERASPDAVETLRRELHPSPCVVLDRPPELDVDPWGPLDATTLALMRHVKERFDPAGVCNSGVYVL